MTAVLGLWGGACARACVYVRTYVCGSVADAMIIPRYIIDEKIKIENPSPKNTHTGIARILLLDHFEATRQHFIQDPSVSVGRYALPKQFTKGLIALRPCFCFYTTWCGGTTLAMSAARTRTLPAPPPPPPASGAAGGGAVRLSDFSCMILPQPPPTR